jgi:hypothetical protein
MPALQVTVEGREPQEVEPVASGTAVVRGSLGAPVDLPSVTYAQLLPIEGGEATVDDRRSARWTRAHDGDFAVENVEAGPYELRGDFAGPGGGMRVRAAQHVEVEEGGEHHVVVVFELVSADD